MSHHVNWILYGSVLYRAWIHSMGFFFDTTLDKSREQVSTPKQPAHKAYTSCTTTLLGDG